MSRKANKTAIKTPGGRIRPWLFEAFPQLRQRIPWTPIVNAPSPVHQLEHVSTRLGRDVWIKRDDKTSLHYGGNKPRKLEFILGDALAHGGRKIVTGGGLGTNHGLATAIFVQQMNFRVLLGLFPQPVTAHVRKNLLLFQAYGAEMAYIGSLLRAVFRYYVTERIRRRGAYFIDPGGSSPQGVLGYVDAGLELAMQVERNEMPLPAAIFLAVGTSGTMAGLVLGLRLAGLRTRVIGVQVAPRAFSSPKTVLRLTNKASSLIRHHDRSVPELELTFEDVPVDRSHYGQGYGHLTDAGRASLRLMAEAEGITLDLTYTAKAFAALLDYLKTESDSKPILFWNTFNSVDLSSVANSVDFRSLPNAFHRFFEGEVANTIGQVG
ncbi:MAG: pyridoxal-phosphate dependent enzyme [Desulfobacterales bacterium]|nr:MAG: pyridoxal-phosphate dependent enzyme [Desulfobacterales bacterium]